MNIYKRHLKTDITVQKINVKPPQMRRLCLKTSEAAGITSSSEEVYELML